MYKTLILKTSVLHFQKEYVLLKHADISFAWLFKTPAPFFSAPATKACMCQTLAKHADYKYSSKGNPDQKLAFKCPQSPLSLLVHSYALFILDGIHKNDQY